MMEAEAVVAQGALKAVCSRDELTRALGIVSRGVSTRTTVQILAGILLEAVDGKLNLAATDMELSLRTSLEAQVEADGAVVVPGRLLLELARLLPDSEVTLEHKVEEAAVEIRCGTATYRWTPEWSCAARVVVTATNPVLDLTETTSVRFEPGPGDNLRCRSSSSSIVMGSPSSALRMAATIALMLPSTSSAVTSLGTSPRPRATSARSRRRAPTSSPSILEDR